MKRARAGRSPDGERDPAAGREHTHELGDCFFRTPEVEDREVPHDCVERRVLERKGVHVGLAKVEPGMQSAPERNHVFRDVHANHRGSPLGRPGRDVPGARGKVEHSRFWPHRSGIEQRLHRLAGGRSEGLVVHDAPPFPAGCLEGVEGIRIDRAVRHRAPPPNA
jgi:hypothetical protein